MNTCRLGMICCVWLCVLLGTSCAAISPSPDSPLFVPDSDDLKRNHALSQRQDILFPKCEKAHACAHVNFTKGLLALFENRGAALENFKKVVDLVPNSRLAASSQSWIALLESHQNPSAWNQFMDNFKVSREEDKVFTLATKQLVRDLLEREMIIQQLMHMKELDSATLQALQRELRERGREVEKLTTQMDALEATKDVEEPPPTISIRKLQQELAARDKKIRELNNQLEALKRIDQEMREKTRPVETVPVPAPPPLNDIQKVQ